MRLWSLNVLLTFSLLTVSSTDLICPEECKCIFIEEKLTIKCNKGNMTNVPVQFFDERVEYVIIAPPPDKPNFLSLGPVFTHPKVFHNLKEIHIVNSNLPCIGRHAFWGLKNMQLINLTHNIITEIESEEFRGLINVVEVYLDFNIIDVMSSETFRYMHGLAILSLTHNHIFSLPPRLFRMLGKLSYLDMSYNPLEDINPELFKDVQRLRTFKCRQCMIKRINMPMYYYIPQLEYLDLGENDFEYLNVDEFAALTKLLQLKLDGNQLPVIVDNLFSKQHKLRSLSLQRNRLALLAPASLTNLTSLMHLDISYNKLDRFNLQTFAPVAQSLRTINFSGNNLPLNEIVSVLHVLPELQGVGLAYLSIDEIPTNFFAHNSNLLAIDLSGNKFTKFPLQAFSKMRFLQRLNMSHNRLQALDESVLERMEAIAQIDISANTWRCDRCSVGVALLYMQSTVLNETLRNLYCYSPPRLRNVPFSKLTYAMLEPCNSAQESQVSVIAGLMLVCIAILAVVATVLCCNRRRAAHFYPHEEKRCSRASDERATDASGEQIQRFELGSVATIHGPHHGMPKSS